MRQTHVLTLKTSDHPSSRLLQSPPTPGMAAIALQASSCFIHASRRRSISAICLSRSSKPLHCSRIRLVLLCGSLLVVVDIDSELSLNKHSILSVFACLRSND